MAAKATMPPAIGTPQKSHTANIQAEKAPTAPKKRKMQPKKADDEGLLATLCTLISDHQIGMSLPQHLNTPAAPFKANLDQAYLSTSSLSSP